MSRTVYEFVIVQRDSHIEDVMALRQSHGIPWKLSLTGLHGFHLLKHIDKLIVIE